jgi:GNAT superfamily N-acetyltransferase
VLSERLRLLVFSIDTSRDLVPIWFGVTRFWSSGERAPGMARAMSAVTLRFAIAEDAGLLLRLIRELAAYERAPEAVVATEEDLRRHGFGPDRRFEALLAFVGGEPAGFALFFPDFSTWRGRPGLFLEDLYVREWARRRGVGRRLIARLAAIAIERDWPALHFNVLDWNPARSFYERLGIEARTAWVPYGATGDALRRLAAEDVGDAE